MAMRAVIPKGKNLVWRHAAPPGSVMIGAMALTSCAMLAAFARQCA